MAIRLDDRVVIITGAGGGLGRTYALSLAQLGAKVVVNDPGGAVDGQGGDSSAADKVVAEIKASGGQAAASYDSVASFEGAQNIVTTAVKAFGRVDTLINNAGILRDKSFAKMPIEDFELVFQVHFMGSLYCTKAVWPLMMDQGFGRIVLTTSVAGLAGGFGQANYGSAKAAVVGLMNVLKIEGAKYNILTNCISPVAADTRMAGAVADPKLVPLVTANHVVPAVAWLSSENCNVSGEIIGASGGYFTAVRYYRSEGVLIDSEGAPTVDQFDAATGQLFDFTSPQPYNGTMKEWMRRMQQAGKLPSDMAK